MPPPLNLPGFAFRTREENGRQMIYDPLRQKYVRLTPEEWVRQHFAQYLIQDLGVPPGLIAVERGFTFEGMARRADIVAYGRSGTAQLMAECKAPGVAIRQAAFEQVSRYNRVVQAAYLVVTNGQEHYCWTVDAERRTYDFLDRLPPYEAW